MTPFVKQSLLLTNTSTNTQVTLSQLYELIRKHPSTTSIALTGSAFNLLSDELAIAPLAQHIRIFARMTPDDKVRCVKLQMASQITAMCGDGANDAGALKAAHAGTPNLYSYLSSHLSRHRTQ